MNLRDQLREIAKDLEKKKEEFREMVYGLGKIAETIANMENENEQLQTENRKLAEENKKLRAELASARKD